MSCKSADNSYITQTDKIDLKREIKVGKTRSLLISAFMLLLLVLCMMQSASAAPTLSSIAQTETTVTLSWTKSSDVTFYDYFVAYSASLNGPFNDAAIIGNSSLTSFAVASLTQNTTYYFIVRDWGSNGVNNFTSSSNICEATTTLNPQLSLVSSTSTTVSLRWKDYDTYTPTMPFYAYVIQMSKAGSQFSTLTTISDPAQDSYTVKGLSPGASYQFRIYDEVGTLGQFQTPSNTLPAATQMSPVSEYPSLSVLLPLMMAIFIMTVALAAKKRSSCSP